MRSDRLELRMLDENDATFVKLLYGNTHVTRTLLRIQRPISMKEAREFCLNHGAAYGDYRFGAALRADGSLVAVGTVRVPPERPDTATIGYSVLPAYWGHGFGTELAALLVEFGTGGLGAHEVHATTLADHAGSAQILKKIGFTILEAGATEVDSRGDERRVMRWVLYRQRRELSSG